MIRRNDNVRSLPAPSSGPVDGRWEVRRDSDGRWWVFDREHGKTIGGVFYTPAAARAAALNLAATS